MRPRGEIREALAQAAQALPMAAPGVEPSGVTWRQLAAMACVGFDAAQRTVDNMLAAGELIVVGHKREPHACRPMNLLARPGAAGAGSAPSGFDELARCWADFR